MVQGHTDCNAPMGVVVHRDGENVRLPIVDDGIRLVERTDGPTDITRFAEATVPIEGFGDDDWLQYVDAFRPTSTERPRGNTTPPGASTGLQVADVVAAPTLADGTPAADVRVAFRGYIAAVGSTSGANRARFRIYDPVKLLDSIEAGVRFNGASVSDVLGYIRDRLVSVSGLEGIRVDIGERVGQDVPLQWFDEDAAQQAQAQPQQRPGPQLSGRERTFSTARDTLADVLSWFRETSNVRVFFEPTTGNPDSDGIRLVADSGPTNEWDLRPDSGSPPYVIENDVLYELRPFNGIRLVGKPGFNLELPGGTRVNTPIPTPWSEDYYEVTATYDPLVQRYGGELLVKDTVDYNTAEALVSAAPTRLKDKLDDLSGGTVTTSLAPVCRPQDTLLLTPACNAVGVDVQALPYEVQRAEHKLIPDSPDVAHSTIHVGMMIDPDNITVGEPKPRDSTTEGTPSQDPAYEDLEYGTK